MVPASPQSRSSEGSGSEASLVKWPVAFPVELITYVFKLAVIADASASSSGFPFPSKRTAPLVMTWVCSTWRNLALSFPQLWTSISLGTNGSRPSEDIGILRLFLSRSGNTLPLSLILDYEPNEPRKAVTDTSRYFSDSYLSGMRLLAQELIPLRHRWRVLSLNALVFGAIEPFLQALALGAGSLSYLKISTKYLGFYGVHQALELASCPRLETVCIWSPMVFSDPSIPRLQHLETLELRYCQSQLDAITWLSACPKLRKLSIRLYAAEPTAPSLLHEITLNNLRELSLTCLYGDSDPGPLLSCLVAPRLVLFSLFMCDLISTGLSQSWRYVSHFLQRSSCHDLERLELVDTPMSPQELIHVLSLAPHVKALTLGGTSVTDEVLQALFVAPTLASSSASYHPFSQTPLPLCVELEKLELHDIAGSMSLITDLVVSRAWSADTEVGRANFHEYRTLKSLTLNGFTNFRDQFPSTLQVKLNVLEPEMEFVPGGANSAPLFSI